jgi:hypothetical protein
MGHFYRALLVILCCLIILPFFLLAGYNHPSSDDYIQQVIVNEQGFFSMWFSYLESWGGRYLSGILVFLLSPLQFSSPNWVVVTTCLQLGLYVLFLYLITLLIDQQFELKHGKLPVFTLLLLYGFCYLPSPVELLYWFSGSWTYLPGLVALSAWAILRFSQTETLNFIKKFGYVILPFLIAGTNELNILFMGFLFILPGRIHPQLSKLNIFMYILFAMGAGFALFSPGNSIRAEVCGGKGNPVFELSFAIQNCIRIAQYYFRDWSRSGPLLLIPVILFLLSDKKTVSPSLKKIGVLCILSILFYLFLTFPFFWATGLKTPPGRIYDYLFLTLSLIVIFSGTFLLHNRINNVNVSPGLPVLLVVFVCWTATYNSRYRIAIQDLKEIEEYSDEYEDRMSRTKLAAQTNPGDTLIVPQLTKRPLTIFYTELNVNSKHWFNRGFASYYGVAGIRAVPSQTKD